MKNNKKYFITLFFLIFAIVLLISNLFIMVKTKSPDKVNNFAGIVNWDDYQSCFEYVVDNFKIEDFSVKASTKGGNLTAVNVYEGLNNRPYITIDGENNHKTTEEKFVIEDSNQNIQITITLILTGNYIGYDILSYSTNNGFPSLNEKLVKASTNVMGSYNNLMFNISQCTLNEYDPYLMDEIVIELVRLFQEYFKNNN